MADTNFAEIDQQIAINPTPIVVVVGYSVLFFLAFLPQFVTLDGIAIPLQLMLLGLLYVALAVLTDGSYALLASYLRRMISARFMRGPVPAYASGLVYLGLGISLALADRKA